MNRIYSTLDRNALIVIVWIAIILLGPLILIGIFIAWLLDL